MPDTAGFCVLLREKSLQKVCRKTPAKRLYDLSAQGTNNAKNTPEGTRPPGVFFYALFCSTAYILCHSVSADAALAARERSIQQVFLGPLSSGALPLPEFRIATNCCSCLRELTPSLS